MLKTLFQKINFAKAGIIALTVITLATSATGVIKVARSSSVNDQKVPEVKVLARRFAARYSSAAPPPAVLPLFFARATLMLAVASTMNYIRNLRI